MEKKKVAMVLFASLMLLSLFTGAYAKTNDLLHNPCVDKVAPKGVVCPNDVHVGHSQEYWTAYRDLAFSRTHSVPVIVDSYAYLSTLDEDGAVFTSGAAPWN